MKETLKLLVDGDNEEGDTTFLVPETGKHVLSPSTKELPKKHLTSEQMRLYAVLKTHRNVGFHELLNHTFNSALSVVLSVQH